MCPILTSCSELSHRVVSPAYAFHSADLKPALFLAVTHAALTNWEYMHVIRLAADPKVFLQPCLLYSHYRFPTQNRRPARPAEKLLGLGDSRPIRTLSRRSRYVRSPVLMIRIFWPPVMGVSTYSGIGQYPLSFWQDLNWLDYVRSFLCSS